MEPVNSSAISHIGYDQATHELRVRFRGGNTYAYGNVPPAKHAALMGAKSIGKQFAEISKVHQGTKVNG